MLLCRVALYDEAVKDRERVIAKVKRPQKNRSVTSTTDRPNFTPLTFPITRFRVTEFDAFLLSTSDVTDADITIAVAASTSTVDTIPSPV